MKNRHFTFWAPLRGLRGKVRCLLAASMCFQMTLDRTIGVMIDAQPTTAVSSACCRAADHRHPTLRAHHTDTTWHSSLAADVTAHHIQRWCLTVLAIDVQNTLVMCSVYIASLHVSDYDQRTWQMIDASCPTALGALRSVDVPTCVVPRTLSMPRRHNFCSRWTSLVELSSGPAAQSRHHLRTVQTTAEGTPFSKSMNTTLCDFWHAAP